MNEELVKYETTETPSVWQPVMSIQAMVDRHQMMAHIVKEIMVSGQHFGIVPGTGTKPTLLKPGAEMLSTFFGLQKSFAFLERTEDWTGADHNGEPFFYYLVRCDLTRNGMVIASGEGSCNSWEKKYRYRSGERQCPACGKSGAIIKGKEEYGGGWVCFGKKGGCGAKFKAGDPTIESQSTGIITNPDIYDLVNTILKMAEKRALVASTLLAVGASDFFTQDMEDILDAEWTERPPEPKTESPTELPTKAEIAHEPLAKSNGTGRPWDTKTLVKMLNDKTNGYIKRSAEWAQTAPDGLRGGMVGVLDKLLGSTERRHTFLRIITGDPSSKNTSHAMSKAIMDWYEMSSKMATKEANLLVNTEIQAGMIGELFDTTQTGK